MKTRKVTKAIPFPELRGSVDNVTYPALAEAKYDGEYTVIHWHRKIPAVAMNKYGKCREDFSALNDLNELLLNSEANSCTLLAELFFGTGVANSLYELLSNKESNDLHLSIFDCAGINGKHIGKMSLMDRKELLFELIGNNFAPFSSVVNSKKEAEDYFAHMTDVMKFEGIVLKSLDSTLVMGPCGWAKMKKKDQSEFEVLVVDPVAERIEVGVPVTDKSRMLIGNQLVSVGCKAPNKYKSHIKVGDMVTIEHQGILASGSLRHPVLIPKTEWK